MFNLSVFFMVCEFFNDIIFRKEDVEEEYSILPGDLFELDFVSEHHYKLYLVRLEPDFSGVEED